MSDLYKKISHSDRQTIVRKYEAGTTLSTGTSPPQTIVLTVDVAAKVTQEYDAYKLQWNDVSIHLDGMVETLPQQAYRRPPPTSMPMDRQVHVEPLPKAEVKKNSFWLKIFG